MGAITSYPDGAPAVTTDTLVLDRAGDTYKMSFGPLATWRGVTPGTGVATFLATPSSANLAAAVTDETGSGSLVFSASPTFTGTVGAAAITATGAVATGALTVTGTLSATGIITATGGAIAFPATQVASADANTLDDYEEGTFTPALKFGGASTGMTYSYQSGRYTKIGRSVTVQVYIVLSAKGSSTGAATITALPFTSASSPFSGGAFFAEGLTTVATPMFYIDASTTTIVLSDGGTGAVAPLAETDFTDTSQIILSTTYFV